jgi:UDP-2-acetamido-2,6-beta-L-arabino-hexul-4-ose reductase
LTTKQIAITGASGFIGSNLRVRLRDAGYTDVILLGHGLTGKELKNRLEGIDLVFHLAGVNRPENLVDFDSGNACFTKKLVEAMAQLSMFPRIAFASSTQATLENHYGRSKLFAEDTLQKYSEQYKTPLYLFRLTNVFGKWCQPNYNSAVATFCHNIARNLPITVHDPSASLSLVYIDDVMDAFIELLKDPDRESGFVMTDPIYETTVGEVVEILKSCHASRNNLIIPQVGTGLIRALYVTYMSYLPPEIFSYEVPLYADKRGVFVEMLKTTDSGQFSYFTANPGVTRGEHYHHSKTEKFLVIKGTAHFAFRHIETGEMLELVVCGGEGKIVETIPGWTHNITNTGAEDLIVMLWANEILNRSRPDTIKMKVKL